ncbi:MAG: SWIM zinc finger domain-containing protein [Hyphomonadaceae bacterium]|nr:SWIM zinc finger domain-containing protein [Hyphomonadaceae bacterium]
MGLTRSLIEAMAPDQSALSAASALLKPAKWPVRARADSLIWGECQGSGANPYRVVADTADHGSKCTCPSRKFPCKHALALMWMYVDNAAAFQPGSIPDWVNDWMGRRRKGAAAPVSTSNDAKSLDVAAATLEARPLDPLAEARRKAASGKRALETRRSVRSATEDLDLWIEDQFRTGLAGFLGELSERCRRIAARLVDAKAAALASRVDEMPSRLLTLPNDGRIDAAIRELGKLALLTRAWRAQPDDPELRREVINSESRDDVLNNADAPRVRSTWEVLGEQITTRRDGLISQSTWLLNTNGGPQRFALLLDFFPASAGRRGGAFVAGESIDAELAFYPACAPLRAVIAARQDAEPGDGAWPAADADPITAHAAQLMAAPWRVETPVLLSAGRLVPEGKLHWWRSDTGIVAPLRTAPPLLGMGAAIDNAFGLWDGARLSLVAARTNWGRLAFDA